jgi:uncharacterized protein
MDESVITDSVINLEPKHLNTVRQILNTKLPGVDAFAFGSRVTSTFKKHSDLDVALVPSQPIDWKVLAELREAFEESDLPIRVDVIDWTSCSDDFKRYIAKKVPL